jgi:hypothetical protein
MKVIGFCGYAKSGKDTAAKVLIDQGWKRVAFADALKSDILYMMCLGSKHMKLAKDATPNWSWFNDPVKKEMLRPLMVEYGRAMRRFVPDYWIRRAKHLYLHGKGNFVITDVRYANEAAMIREMGGIVLKVERMGVNPANEEERNSFQTFSPDYLIPNLGTIAQLHELVLQHADSYPEKD